MKRILTCIVLTLLTATLSAADGNVTRLYCKVTQSWWTDGNATVGIYAWTEDQPSNADWPGVRMTAVDGENGLWYADVDTEAYQKIIFTRLNADEVVEYWGAKTQDLLIPTDGKNLYTITSTTAQWDGDGGVIEGEWSVYGDATGNNEPDVIWSGEMPISWNEEVCEGTQFDTYQSEPNLFQDIEQGDTIRLSYVTNSAGAQISLSDKEGEEWTWTQLVFAEMEEGSTTYAYVIDDATTAANIAERGLAIAGQCYTLRSIALRKNQSQQSTSDLIDIWVGDTPISWNPEMCEGEMFDAENYQSGLFQGVEAGYVIEIGFTKSADAQIVMTYKAGDDWEWMDLATLLPEDEAYATATSLRYTIQTEEIAQYIAERGIVVRGQCFNLTRISIAANSSSGGDTPGTQEPESAIAYYLIGSDEAIGSWMGENAAAMVGDSAVVMLSAGVCEFKVVPSDWNWGNALSYANVNTACSSLGIASGDNDDVHVTMAAAGAMKVKVVNGQLCITGDFSVPEVANYYLVGSMTDNWNIDAVVPFSGDSLAITLDSGIYQFKIFKQDKSWDDMLNIKDLEIMCSSNSVTNGEYDNIKIVLSTATEVRIKVNAEGKLCINGNFEDDVTITSYSVVGDPNLLGGNWDIQTTQTEMTLQENGVWTYVIDSVQLNAGDYQYKIVANHSWDVAQYPQSGDYILTVSRDGTYSVTFTLVPGEGGSATTTLLRGNHYLVGSSSYLGSWTMEDAHQMERDSISIYLPEGFYEFKVYPQNTSWDNELGYSNLDMSCSSENAVGDLHNSICIRMAQSGRLVVKVVNNKLCLNANLSKIYYLGLTTNSTEGISKGTAIINNIDPYNGTCGITCTPNYSVTLHAYPEDGFYFTQWSDGNTDNPRQFVISETQTLTAIFEEEEKKYYLVGSGDVLGSWTIENALPMDGDSIVLNLPANAYEFKVFPQNTSWDNEMGYTSLNLNCSSNGLIKGASNSNNIKFIIEQEDIVNVKVVDGQICVTGVFGTEVTINNYSIVGDSTLLIEDWNTQTTTTEMTQQEGNIWTYHIDSVALRAGLEYRYKVIANHTWSVVQYPSDSTDYILTVPQTGIYSVTFTLIPSEGVTEDITLIRETSCYVASGTCGEYLTWNLSCDSILSIRGSGAMDDYNWDPSPWYESYRDFIKKVVIEGYVTRIGAYAFNNCSQITTISMPDSVESIGSFAFRGCGKLSSINIPFNLITIEDDAFRECSSLTNIALPNNVKSIGERVFKECYYLNTIVLPNSVTSIGKDAFYECTRMNAVHINNLTAWCRIVFGNNYANPLSQAHHLYLDNSEITELIIPDDVTEIKKYAFYLASSLTSVNIHGNVSSIGKHAFDGCTRMSSINISHGLRTIDEYALYNCSGLLSIDIPNSVTEIGAYALYGCNNLTTIEIPNSITILQSSVIRYCWRLTSVYIPESVIGIESSVFEDCHYLTSITIPSSVTYIAERAFYNCHRLQNLTCKAITPPEAYASITHTFYGVDNSLPIYVPAVSINAYKSAEGWNEFTNILPMENTYYLVGSTDALGSWTIENALPMNGDSILLHLSPNAYQFKIYPQQSWDNEINAANINYDCTSTNVIEGYNRNILFALEEEGDVLIRMVDGQVCMSGAFAGNIITGYSVVGDSLMLGANWDPTFTGTDMTQQEGGTWTYTIDSVSLIGQRGYEYKVVSNHTWDLLQYPAYVDSGNYVLTVPETGIYAVTFTFIPSEGCTAEATVVSTPPCIKASGTCGASGSDLTWNLSCDSVLTISGVGTMSGYGDMGNSVYTTTPWTSYTRAIKALVLEVGVKNVGKNTFTNCTNLTSVQLPEGLTSIGESAFSGCSKLNSITLPSTLKQISKSAFSNCESLTELTIPDAVTSIGESAFNGCKRIQEIVVPNNVTSIERYAFANIDSLKSFTLGRKVTSLGVNPILGCPNLRTIVVDELNTWYNSQDNCNAILNTRQKSLVAGCATTIIPDSITRIESYAFYEQSALESITLHAGISYLGTYAFSGCSGVQSITCYATVPPSLEAFVTLSGVSEYYEFNDINKSTPVYVPIESVNQYKAQAGWNAFKNIQPIGGYNDTVSTAAPTPEWPAEQVKSIYSDAYVFAPASLLSYNEPWWNQPNLEERTIGNDHYLYYNLYRAGMIGSQFAEISVVNMEKVHIDVYSPATGTIKFNLLTADPDESDDTQVTLNLQANQWNSFDINLSEFGEHDWTRLFQFSIMDYEAAGLVGLHIAVDNIYLYRTTALVDNDAPTNVTATVTEVSCFSAKLALSAEDNMGVVNYTILHGEDTLVTAIGASGLTIQTAVPNLSPATMYNLTIMAADENNNLAEPVILEVTTQEAPESPALNISDKRIVSVFCDAADNNPYVTIGNWAQTTVANKTLLAEGDSVFHATQFDYLGWDISPAVNANDMEYLHVDFYTTNIESISLTPISPPSVEGSYTVNLNQGTWTSVDVPLSAYYGSGIDWSNIYQFKFMDATPAGGELIIDNVYFYRSKSATRVEDFTPADGTKTTTYVTEPTTKTCSQADWTVYLGGILTGVGKFDTYAAVVRAKKSSETEYGYLQSSTISGGINDLWFTWNSNGNESGTNWDVKIYVNDQLVGNITDPASAQLTEPPFNTFRVSDLHIEGNFTIKIVNESPNSTTNNKMRMVIDDLSWTTYDSSDSTGTYIPEPVIKHGVNWIANGELMQTDSIEDGKKMTSLPAAPQECASGQVFVGWTDILIEGAQDEEPAVLYTSAADIPSITDDVMLYAVFAYEGVNGTSQPATYTYDADHQDGWVNTASKNGSYWVINSTGELTSPQINLAGLQSITMKVRTYGGTTNNTVKVFANDMQIASIQAENNTFKEVTWENTEQLSGFAQLQFKADYTGTAGVGFSSVSVSTTGGSIVRSQYVTTCSPDTGRQYYLTGSGTELGAWTLERALYMENDMITLALPANAYEFMVLPQNTGWGNELGYSNLNMDCSSEGLEQGSGNNIKFTLAQEGEVSIRVENRKLCVTGLFGGEVPITGYSVVGDSALFGTEWDSEDMRTEMTLQEGGTWTYTIDSVALVGSTEYKYKVIANHTWAVRQYPSSDNNYTLNVSRTGIYSITFTLDPNTGATAVATCIGGVLYTMISCAEAVTLMPSSATNNETELPYSITGYVTNTNGVVSPSRTDESIMQQTFYMADEKGGSNTVQAYYCNLPDGEAAVQAGDKVILSGKIIKYNNMPEVKNGEVTILERDSAVVIDTLYVSACEAIVAGKRLDNLGYSTDIYVVGGRLQQNVSKDNNNQYTFDLSCDTIFEAYHCNAAEGIQLEKGDSVHVIGRLYNYKGLIEISQGEVVIAEKYADCRMAHGTCGAQGDNLTWSISCIDTVLTVSGSGAMADYTNDSLAPYAAYATQVTALVIDSGVTHIGSLAFSNMTALTSIQCLTTTPPTMADYNAFEGLDMYMPVYVPCDSKQLYKESEIWSKFLNILCQGEEPMVFQDITCQQAVELMPATKNATTDRKYNVIGYVTSTNSEVNSSRQQTFYMNDTPDTTNIVQAYLCVLPENEEALQIGDYVMVTSKIMNYNGKPELKNGTVTILQRDTNVVVDTITVNVREAIERGKQLLDLGYSKDVYIVYGRIANSGTNSNGLYSFEMPYDTAVFKPYHCQVEEGMSFAKNDSIRVIGKLYNYHGTIEISQGRVEMVERYEDCRLASGMCGDSLTWGVACDGRLLIEGSGNMSHYSHSMDIPWFYYSDIITSINIGEDVTSLDAEALYICNRATKVSCMVPEPIDIDSATFSRYDTLVVPCMAKFEYQKAPYWQDFNLIQCTGEEPDTIRCEQAVALMPTTHNTTTNNTYTVTGYVTSTNGDLDDQNRQKFYMNDTPDGANILMGFWCKLPKGAAELHVGDKIALTGKILNYHNTTEIKNGSITIFERAEYTTPDTISIDVCEAIERGKVLKDLSFTHDVFVVHGRLADNEGTNEEGQLILDLLCDTTVFRAYHSVAADSLTFKKGDSVKVNGKIQNFHGVIEISHGAVELLESYACRIANGKCGADGDSTNVLWEITCDSILVISGSGAMADYQNGIRPSANPEQPAGASVNPRYKNSRKAPSSLSLETPWKDYIEVIKAIRIEEGVTRIGENAFAECSRFTEISMPNSLDEIGKYAFENATAIHSVTIPEGVTMIEDFAFYNTTGLDSLYCLNPVPATIYSETFSTEATTVLIVPDSSVTLYRAAAYWSDFANIRSANGKQMIPMSGIYRVGGNNANFTYLHEATEAIRTNGLAGDVTLLICADIAETANVGITNTSNYTITIRPDAAVKRTISFGDTPDNYGPVGHVIIGYNTAANVWESIETQHVIIDGSFEGEGQYLEFQAGSIGGCVLVYYGHVTNSIVRNCRLINTRTTGTNYVVHFRTEQLASSSSNANKSDNAPLGVGVDNCYLEVIGSANSQCVYFNGSQSATNAGKPTDCYIRNSEIVTGLRGVFFNGANNATIEGNTFRMPNAPNGYMAHAIMGNAQTGTITIRNNRFVQLATANTIAGDWGIRGINANGGADVWIIENNTFAGLDAIANISDKIITLNYVRCYDSCVVRHNTFYMPSLTYKPATALVDNQSISCIYMAGTRLYSVENNIFVSEETEAYNSLICRFMNNNIRNNVFFHRGGNAAVWADDTIAMSWEEFTATGAHVGSAWVEPQFTNAAEGDLSLARGYREMKMRRLDDVLTDINGTLRNDSTYAGAYEFDGTDEPYSDPNEYITIHLTEEWQFIMLPGLFGLSAADVTTYSEVVWATYSGERRAAGISGWTMVSIENGFMPGQAYIVSAKDTEATLTIHVPADARNRIQATLPFSRFAAGHQQNANWNFVGNPYPFPFDILNALDAMGISSPITVWNGTGYDMYTPGIDEYILQPFEAFFIQLPDNGTEAFQLLPEYIMD